MVKWYREAHLLVKLWALLSAFLLSFHWVRDHFDGGMALFLICLSILPFYVMYVAVIRGLLWPFGASLRTMRRGYRSAVVAPRLVGIVGAENEALQTLAQEGDPVPFSTPFLADLDWPARIRRWQQTRYEQFVLPALCAASLWAYLFYTGSENHLSAAAGLMVLLYLYGAFRSEKAKPLVAEIETALGDTLGAEPSAETPPPNGAGLVWTTPLGRVSSTTEGRTLTLTVEYPNFDATVDLITGDRLSDEEIDVDFGDRRFDPATLVTARYHVFPLRLQLSKPARTLLLGALEGGARTGKNGLSRQFDLADPELPQQIETFARLAWGLRCTFDAHEARSLNAQLRYALENADSLEERTRLLKSLAETNMARDVREALLEWVETASDASRFSALEVLPSPVQARATEAILADPEEQTADQSRALGLWVARSSADAIACLHRLVSAGEHALVAPLLEAKWGEGHNWRFRPLQTQALFDAGPVDGDTWSPMAGLLVVAFRLAAAQSRPETDTTIQDRMEALKTLLQRGAATGGVAHLMVLKHIRRVGAWESTLAPEIDTAIDTLEREIIQRGADTAGQLSLSTSGSEGALSVASEDTGPVGG